MKELTNLKTLNNKKLLVVLPLNTVEDVLLNECAYSLAKQEFDIDLLVLANNQLTEKDIEQINSILKQPKITLKIQDDKGEMSDQVLISETPINYAIELTNSNTFQEVFNEAFNYAERNTYEWFSVVEHEDVLDFKWLKMFDTFSEEKQDVGMFLPIIREIHSGVFTGFFNEASWSEGLAEVAGYTDLQLMLRFNCINLTGGVYKIELLKEYSDVVAGVYKPIKESIQISYIYEFFLRMIYNDIKVFTIPRVGYERRIINKPGKINWLSCKIPTNLVSIPKEDGGLTEAEVRFWVELAKKEYFFDNDRKIDFQEQISTP